MIKKICLVLKHYDFLKWLFKGSHLVPKKKKRKKKEKSHFKKKKKIILFQKSSSLELRLDLILYEKGM